MLTKKASSTEIGQKKTYSSSIKRSFSLEKERSASQHTVLADELVLRKYLETKSGEFGDSGCAFFETLDGADRSDTKYVFSTCVTTAAKELRDIHFERRSNSRKASLQRLQNELEQQEEQKKEDMKATLQRIASRPSVDFTRQRTDFSKQSSGGRQVEPGGELSVEIGSRNELDRQRIKDLKPKIKPGALQSVKTSDISQTDDNETATQQDPKEVSHDTEKAESQFQDEHKTVDKRPTSAEATKAVEVKTEEKGPSTITSTEQIKQKPQEKPAGTEATKERAAETVVPHKATQKAPNETDSGPDKTKRKAVGLYTAQQKSLPETEIKKELGAKIADTAEEAAADVKPKDVIGADIIRKGSVREKVAALTEYSSFAGLKESVSEDAETVSKPQENTTGDQPSKAELDEKDSILTETPEFRSTKTAVPRPKPAPTAQRQTTLGTKESDKKSLSLEAAAKNKEHMNKPSKSADKQIVNASSFTVKGIRPEMDKKERLSSGKTTAKLTSEKSKGRTGALEQLSPKKDPARQASKPEKDEHVQGTTDSSTIQPKHELTTEPADITEGPPKADTEDHKVANLVDEHGVRPNTKGQKLSEPKRRDMSRSVSSKKMSNLTSGGKRKTNGLESLKSEEKNRKDMRIASNRISKDVKQKVGTKSREKDRDKEETSVADAATTKVTEEGSLPEKEITGGEEATSVEKEITEEGLLAEDNVKDEEDRETLPRSIDREEISHKQEDKSEVREELLKGEAEKVEREHIVQTTITRPMIDKDLKREVLPILRKGKVSGRLMMDNPLERYGSSQISDYQRDTLVGKMQGLPDKIKQYYAESKVQEVLTRQCESEELSSQKSAASRLRRVIRCSDCCCGDGVLGLCSSKNK